MKSVTQPTTPPPIVIAQQYRPDNMGPTGNAKNMLIKQYQFPLVFESDQDELYSVYFDQVQEQYPQDTKSCLNNYKIRVRTMEDDLLETEDTVLMDFLCTLLKVERKKYTGYRILGTVSATGHAHYKFELFSKHQQN